MSDVRDNVFSFLDDWYGQLNDIIEDLKEHDFDVLNATSEWIDVSKDDKEYVLKLGGTERTITINSIESLNESVKSLTEGGIYPVGLYGGAEEAFIKSINEILGGNILEVDNLELIPSLGFGGRYWYRANITLDEDTIVNFITEESTPEAKRLLNNETLIINPYSDISILCSANKEQYQDGTTLDALNDSDANMETLDKESDIIGGTIIAKLIEAEDKIIEVLKNYEEVEDDSEYIDESLIPIEEASHPKLGKRVKSLKGWKIYQGTNDNGDEIFRCFTPDDDRPMVGYEDWETETLEQAISWIENYDLEESKKVNNEDNKEIVKEGSEGESSDSENGTIVVERKTFGDYEKNVFTALDNMSAYISAFEEVNNDTLKALIDNLEDELEVLKDIDMKMLTGIKQYTL